MSDRELYVGAALAQIMEGTGFRSIRKASQAFGHIELNGTRRVLIRHSAAEGAPWSFTLREKDLALLKDDHASHHRAFLCLVCRDELVCILTIAQVAAIVDVHTDRAQTIRVFARRSSSIEVRGSAGKLDRRIPRHAFPGRLFHHGERHGAKRETASS